MLWVLRRCARARTGSCGCGRAAWRGVARAGHSAGICLTRSGAREVRSVLASALPFGRAAAADERTSRAPDLARKAPWKARAPACARLGAGARPAGHGRAYDGHGRRMPDTPAQRLRLAFAFGCLDVRARGAGMSLGQALVRGVGCSCRARARARACACFVGRSSSGDQRGADGAARRTRWPTARGAGWGVPSLTRRRTVVESGASVVNRECIAKPMRRACAMGGTGRRGGPGSVGHPVRRS
jgi:hypothetical protein